MRRTLNDLIRTEPDEFKNRPALDLEANPLTAEEEEAIRGWLRFSKGKHFATLRELYPKLYDAKAVVDADGPDGQEGWWSKGKEADEARVRKGK